MTDRIKKGGLEIAAELHDLVANEIAPGTGVEAVSYTHLTLPTTPYV